MTQSKITMPVISQEEPNRVLSSGEFDDFWDNKPLQFTVTEYTKILSYVQKIPLVDPLAFLQNFTAKDTVYFYWENPNKKESIAACGITKKSIIRSEARFDKTQKFIDNCFKQITSKGEVSLSGSEPRIFCSFSFFSDASTRDNDFPPATVFLPRFQLIKKNKKCFLIVNYPLKNIQEKAKIIRKLNYKIATIDWLKQENLTINDQIESKWDRQNIFSSEHSQYFRNVVGSALESIAVNEFSKIVIAQATDITSLLPFRVIQSLHNLRERHPDCYIFSIANGQGKNFIGASPERLVSIQNKQLVTDALAGSAPRGKTNAEDIRWSNLLLRSRKEKREHQAVSDFLIERLRQMGLRPHQLPLQLLQLSNIQHLWTPIYAHLPKDIEPLDIVAQLHPTPAVAGVGTEIACERIRHYEKFDRSLYAAPLGWIDNQGNSEFIVGIRSALIEGKHARLYAGAGIVSGSNPDKEFIEIQLKLQSLLKALV